MVHIILHYVGRRCVHGKSLFRKAYHKICMYKSDQGEWDIVIQRQLHQTRHFDEPETLYQRMLFGVFDPQTNKRINTTSDISGAKFSRYHCHSGLINGKGRFYNSSTSHNGSPLYFNLFNFKPIRCNNTHRWMVLYVNTERV
jgi:hypothetical protein